MAEADSAGETAAFHDRTLNHPESNLTKRPSRAFTMNRMRLLCQRPAARRYSMLAVFSAFALAAVAVAQPPPSNPYNPWGPPIQYNWGPGATLSGGAQLLQAQGDLSIQMEQARQQRQQYYQDKLQTQKMAFDQANYERANTPTATEEQAKTLGRQVQRILNQANPAEIKRGDTLNTLMPYIRAMSDRGVPGPPIPINPAMLRQVNVRVGTTAGAPGAGLLKDGGRLSWPLMLRGPRQKQIDKLLPEAVSAAAAGTLEPAQFTKLVSEVQSMQDELRKGFHAQTVTSSDFLSGGRYLDSLMSSLSLLQRPDAAMFFNGGYTAHGSNVPELVDNMSGQGLTFAPATPGVEAPYFALHNAFVSYARTAQAAAGFNPKSLR
jgi:hypothetical protein